MPPSFILIVSLILPASIGTNVPVPDTIDGKLVLGISDTKADNNSLNEPLPVSQMKEEPIKENTPGPKNDDLKLLGVTETSGLLFYGEINQPDEQVPAELDRETKAAPFSNIRIVFPKPSTDQPPKPSPSKGSFPGLTIFNIIAGAIIFIVFAGLISFYFIQRRSQRLLKQSLEEKHKPDPEKVFYIPEKSASKS